MTGRSLASAFEHGYTLVTLWLLTMLGPSLSAQPVPRPALNHAYLVLDSLTFEAARTSEFFRTEFASTYQPIDSAVSERSGKTLYVQGRHTYLELFAPGARPLGVGFFGIAYGFDHPGGLEWIKRQWEENLGLPVYEQTQTFTRSDGSSGAFFRAVGIQRQATIADRGPVLTWATAGVRTWAMEYDPGFLRERFGDTTTVSFLTRERFNARRFAPERLLEDVVGVTLALPTASRDSLLAQLAAIGFSISQDGHSRVAQGDGFQIRAETDQHWQRGIVQVDFRLSRTVQAKTYALGNSVLEILVNGTAKWTLGTLER